MSASLTGSYQRSVLELALINVNRAAELALQYREDGYAALEKGSLEGLVPQLSLDESRKKAKSGADILELLNQVDDESLPHDFALTSKLLRYYADNWVKEGEHYWLATDFAGSIFYGPFAQTAYTGGYVMSAVSQILGAFQFRKDGDGERYLTGIAELTRFLHQVHERTAGQAERGIRIFKPHLGASRSLLAGLSASLQNGLLIDESRLAGFAGAEALRSEVSRRIHADIAPAFASLSSQLDDKYEALAPDGVGMSALPGGAAVYRDLAVMHTTMSLTPEQIHGRGHERMERIQAQMVDVRAKLGFNGEMKDFAAFMRGPLGVTAKNAEDIGERMRRHKDRLDQRYDEFFSKRSPSEHDLVRMPEALEGSMTWGYYAAPTPHEKRGLYNFNGSKLDSLAVIGAASLVFHELVPGHHLHMTLQQANENLSPIRKSAAVNAFTEGWAEYAATLTGEMGLYENPIDEYGRLAMDAFLTCRLVVDTGMNALGWSLEQARQYLADKTLCTPQEILTDTLRYSCSLPGQALAYKLGDEEILRMRKRVMNHLKGDFDYRHFHSAILEVGGLPLPVLEWHLEKTYGCGP